MAVKPTWLDTVVAKVEAVAIRILYVAAPVTEPQLMVGEVGWLTEPLDGEASTGVAGIAMIVVKFHAPDHGLVPPAFVAFTSQ
jgi:hypothetical protein